MTCSPYDAIGIETVQSENLTLKKIYRILTETLINIYIEEE